MHSVRSQISTYVYIYALKSGMQFSTCLFYHSTNFTLFLLIPLLGWHLCLKIHSIVTNQNQKMSSPKLTASVMNGLLVLPLTAHKGQLSLDHLQICLLFPLVWFLSTLWLNFWVSNKNNCIMLIPAPVFYNEFQSTEVPQCNRCHRDRRNKYSFLLRPFRDCWLKAHCWPSTSMTHLFCCVLFLSYEQYGAHKREELHKIQGETWESTTSAYDSYRDHIGKSKKSNSRGKTKWSWRLTQAHLATYQNYRFFQQSSSPPKKLVRK